MALVCFISSGKFWYSWRRVPRQSSSTSVCPPDTSRWEARLKLDSSRRIRLPRELEDVLPPVGGTVCSETEAVGSRLGCVTGVSTEIGRMSWFPTSTTSLSRLKTGELRYSSHSASQDTFPDVNAANKCLHGQEVNSKSRHVHAGKESLEPNVIVYTVPGESTDTTVIPFSSTVMLHSGIADTWGGSLSWQCFTNFLGRSTKKWGTLGAYGFDQLLGLTFSRSYLGE